MLANTPRINCPKCGYERAFEGTHPTYRTSVKDYEDYWKSRGDPPPESIKEWLEWFCPMCGYSMKTKTYDDTSS